MAPGAPRTKRKVARGGGKKFSRNLGADVEGEGEREGMWADPRDPKPEVESSEEEESEEEEEEADKPELSREERKAAAKARKEAALTRKAATAPAPGDLPSEDEDEEEEAPKKPIRGAGGISVINPNSASVAEALNRKEREAVEAAAAKERYWKLQEEGKTDQARADLARLAIIRQEREEKAKQRKAEIEERKAASEAKLKGSGRKK